MPTVSPTLNLPQPATSSAASASAMAKPATAASSFPAASATTSTPSTTVTLSPQGMSALAASHPSSSGATSGSAAPVAAPAAQDGSIYDSLKNGISTAFADVGGAIEGGAEAVLHGVEATVSTANDIVKGALELPFAAVAKVADAVGAVIDEF